MRWLVVLALLASCKDRDRSKPAPKPPEPEVACNPAQGTTCQGSDVMTCTDEGQIGAKVKSCENGCKRGACIDTCAAQGVELIYVVDARNNFFSFDPTKLPGDPFHQIGTLTCDRTSSPFSMAVDRHGVAWVAYQNGKVYRVSIIDARCMSAGAVPEPNLSDTFGMGFVANDANTETLFIAPTVGTTRLATLDTSSDPPRVAAVSDFLLDAQNPELTGTGDGKLFGYFPGGGFVTEIDKTNGKPIGTKHKLGTKLENVTAYAFAHYGGVFYVFATNDDVNGVHAINRKTGKYEVVMQSTPNRIVGAGVSTCAPLLERTEP